MNKQGPNGIEWCDYTWNPIAGCLHGCQWTMPDGSVVACYAQRVAEGLASRAYPLGFAHDYWHPDRLPEPMTRKEPARIFVDSMGDLFGHWVPRYHVHQVLNEMRWTRRHTYLSLTKHAPGIRSYIWALPTNLHVGVSIPPTTMWGKTLTVRQQQRMFDTALSVLEDIPANIRWLSLEPLSFDVAPLLFERYHRSVPPFEWLVIGAASNGSILHQPNPDHVQGILELADWCDIPVFMKGNLDWPDDDWRQAYPYGEEP